MPATIRCENPECAVLLRLPNDVPASMQCPRCGHVHATPSITAGEGPSRASPPSKRASAPQHGILERPLAWLSSWMVTRTVPRGAGLHKPEFVCPWCEREIFPERDACQHCGQSLQSKRLESIIRWTLRLRTLYGWLAIGLILIGFLGCVGPTLFLFGWWIAAIPLSACLEQPTYPIPETLSHYASLQRIRRVELVFDVFRAKTGIPTFPDELRVLIAVTALVVILVSQWLFLTMVLM